MRNTRIATLSCAVLLLLAACAERRSADTPLPKGTLAEGAATMTATVESVDLKTRRVRLRTADGRTETIKVPADVQNLPQVKKGDVVVVSYYESVAYAVKPKGSGEPGVAMAGETARAEPGEKPGGVGAAAVTVTATITDIDKKNGTVTITGPDGETATVKAQNPANLDRVRKGDLVDITYAEALAITVEPAGK